MRTQQKPTDIDRLNYINQPVQSNYILEKTDMYFVVNNKILYLYKVDELEDFYISIKDYCAPMESKADGGKFMRSLAYPDIILGYAKDTKNTGKIFFINVHGCKEYITKNDYAKYKDIKEVIHDEFSQFLNSMDTKKEEQTTNNNPLSELDLQNMDDEFEKMFKEMANRKESANNISNPKPVVEEKNTVSILESFENSCNDIKNYIDNLNETIAKLQQEKEILSNRLHKTIDIDKNNALKKFVIECENSIVPFENKHVLNTLTIIIDKAIQEHMANGGGRFDFICGFNNATNRNTIYRDQIKEYDNEPFIRIAMRLYGYEVLHFAINNETFKNYVLHQFKNMFDINITNNKFILSLILGLLSRKVKPCITGTHVSTEINFDMQQV